MSGPAAVSAGGHVEMGPIFQRESRAGDLL